MNDNYGSFTFDLIAININYEIKQKIDLDVTIVKLLNNKASMGTTFAYETETDITTISNLRTKSFNLQFNSPNSAYCYFNKIDDASKLLLICIPNNGQGEIYLGEIKEYIYQSDIHPKYNFMIRPVKNNEIITIKGSGVSIKAVYSQESDLSSGNALTVRYIINSQSINIKIKLNEKSDSYLECKDLTDMLKCIVPLSHFEGQKKGEYLFYTQEYINDLRGCSTFYEVKPIKIKLPEIASMKIPKDNNNVYSIKIGQKGVIHLVTNYNDAENKFEQANLDKSTFDGIFVDEDDKNNVYKSKCKLWKLSDKNINVLCQLEEELKKENQIIYLKQTSFIYQKANNENIGVIISYEADSVNVKQLKSEISFLYADKQNIDIVDSQNTYELRFNQYSKDNRPIYLYSDSIKSIILDSCSNEGTQLICKVSKDNLLEILAYSGEVFSVGEKFDNNGIYKFNSVFDITIKSKIPKQEIKLTIGRLLTSKVSKNEFIAYETSIDSTKSVTSSYFNIDSGVSNDKKHCLFKKSTNQDKLLLLCDAKSSGTSSLGKVNTVKYDNINALYDLTIEESENYETYEVLPTDGTKVYSVNPLELNFNNKDEFIIQYEADYPNNYKGIKLNKDSGELQCESKDGYRQCKVNANHFSSNGKYYTHHSIDTNSEAISYELPMINVILKENPNGGDGEKDESSNTGLIIGLSVAGGVIVLAVVIFLIWHYCRKKDSDEYDSNDNKGKLLTTS
jgi:hypothetical protein